MKATTTNVMYWVVEIKRGRIQFDPFQNETSEYDWTTICPQCGNKTELEKHEQHNDVGEFEDFPCEICGIQWSPLVYEIISNLWRKGSS